MIQALGKHSKWIPEAHWPASPRLRGGAVSARKYGWHLRNIMWMTVEAVLWPIHMHRHLHMHQYTEVGGGKRERTSK